MMAGRHGATTDRRDRFAAIYERHCEPVLGYALRRTANGEDAADVVAETFLTAWRRIDDLPEGDGARLWLYGVARRVLANHHRGERRRSELGDRLRQDLAGVHADPEYTGELATVAAAFRALPDADRELLGLVGWEGLDPKGIAAVLGCSPNAVRIRLHRARRRFAAELEHRGNQPRSALARATNGGHR